MPVEIYQIELLLLSTPRPDACVVFSQMGSPLPGWPQLGVCDEGAAQHLLVHALVLKSHSLFSKVPFFFDCVAWPVYPSDGLSEQAPCVQFPYLTREHDRQAWVSKREH